MINGFGYKSLYRDDVNIWSVYVAPCPTIHFWDGWIPVRWVRTCFAAACSSKMSAKNRLFSTIDVLIYAAEKLCISYRNRAITELSMVGIPYMDNIVDFVKFKISLTYSQSHHFSYMIPRIDWVACQRKPLGWYSAVVFLDWDFEL